MVDINFKALAIQMLIITVVVIAIAVIQHLKEKD